VEHRKVKREWERPSTSSSNESKKLSLCLSPCEPYQEGIDPTAGREEKENKESDEMIKRQRQRECEVVTPPYPLLRGLPLLRTTITPSSHGHTHKRNGCNAFHSEDRVISSHHTSLAHLILSIDLSSCCQQLRDRFHSTASTSEVKGSPSILNTNEMITTLLHPSPSELQFEPQQRGAQSPLSQDLQRKHDGGECSQTEEDKSTRISTVQTSS
jgi:hypothetical protein